MIELIARTLRRTGYVLAALSDGLTASLADDDAEDAPAPVCAPEAATAGPAKVCVSADEEACLVKLGIEAMGGAHDGETVFAFGVSGTFARELATALNEAAEHVDPAA